MRRSLSLALLLVALSALPAAARGAGHASFASQPHFSHFNHFNHFNRFHRFGKSRFSAPWGWNSRWGNSDWDWGLADWDNWGGAPWAGAPGIVLGDPPPTAPRPAPAKATVETEAGVTVFRGPASHHSARY